MASPFVTLGTEAVGEQRAVGLVSLARRLRGFVLVVGDGLAGVQQSADQRAPCRRPPSRQSRSGGCNCGGGAIVGLLGRSRVVVDVPGGMADHGFIIASAGVPPTDGPRM